MSKQGPGRLIAIAVLAGALTLAFTGCGGIDQGKLEDGVASDTEDLLTDPELSVSSVSCPDDIASETGEPFECSIEISDGTTATATGEVTDGDDGDVEYRIVQDG